MSVTPAPTVGKDIIYICQNPNCENREKEFSRPDRNYKFCSKCGSLSIKATLVDSYNYITSSPATDSMNEEETEEYE